MTFGEARTNGQKIVDEAVLARVKKGIALLEERHGPDFADHIDLDALDLQDASACVLGQLYADAEPTDEQWEKFYASEATSQLHEEPGFSRGLAILDGDLLLDAGASYGFNSEIEGSDFEELQAAWLFALEERQIAREAS